MTDTSTEAVIGIFACISLLGLIVVLSVVCLLLRDRLFGEWLLSEGDPTAGDFSRVKYESRILRPDWEFYERHLGRPAPPALRDLYHDSDLITRGGFQYDDLHYISTFEPLDSAAIVTEIDEFGCDVVPFANSDGDIIYLRPGPREPDTVFITYHDGGDTDELATDVEAFLQIVRSSTSAL